MYKKIKQKRTNSSFVHFEKLASLLRDKGVDFYYIPAPIQHKNKYAKGEYKKMFSGFIPEMKEKHGNVFLLKITRNTLEIYLEILFILMKKGWSLPINL